MAQPAENAYGIRLLQLSLTGSSARPSSYGVRFARGDEKWRPLSIIAGPSQTGKTSIIDFVRYCLGDNEHPEHPEVTAAVRYAALEAELAGSIVSIERSATGSPSSFASVWQASLDDRKSVPELRKPTEPTSDPAGLSQYVLAACGLDGIELPEAPTQADSRTVLLSIRDLFRVMWMPNERLDSKNLLGEANYMVAQKLRQTVDAMFDVHDPGDAQLQGRIRKIAEAARQARASAQSVRTVVHDEYPLGPLSLTADLEAAERSAASIAGALARIDAERSSRQGATRWLREELRAAQIVARDARLRVGNRESLLDRLAVLRGQYADDKKKLMFLREAERIFDPLRVVTCPACLSALDVPPSVVDEKCSMCGESIDSEDVHLSLGMAARAIEASKSDADNDTVGQSDAASEGEDSIIEIAETIDELVNAHGLNESVELIERELKATTRRLDDLNQYWVRLDDDLNVLRNIQLNADAEAEAAAEAVNRVADLPAPYLAERDELSRQLADARLRVQHLQTGVRLWDRVDAANLQADQLEGQASRLRKERREAAERPDRRAVISKLSARFGAILSEIGYPKLSEPLIDERLIPSVRGLPYRAASSGGLTLISIAWSLAIGKLRTKNQPKVRGCL